MRQVSLITASVGLALCLGGCGMFGGGSEDSVSQQSPIAAPGSSPGSAEQSPNAQPFSQSTGRAAAQQNRPRGIMPPDLISSTNPDQRLKGIQSVRPDPFALVPTTAAITITRDSQASGSGQSPSSTGSGISGQGLPVRSASGGSLRGSSGGGSSRIPSGSQAMLPQPIPVLPDIPRLPRSLPAALPPQPELARAVNVSGVVQIGSAVYAIVDAPAEPSSRYVQVGQRLSNGEILVKRIDFNGSDSSVVLEQAGMQVVRRVGDVPVAPVAPSAPATPATPAAQPAAAA